MPKTQTKASKITSITLSDEQFRQLLDHVAAISVSAANTRKPSSSTEMGGSFIRSTSRFDAETSVDVVAFLDAATTYKSHAGISDVIALKGLPMLLTGLATIWWLGVKASIETWDGAITAMK